jgi:tetratricopeptide (TPR) repeat protein
MAFLTEIDNNSVLFAGDLCGGGVNSFGGDHDTFKRSLQQLLEKKIDILCEGHMNVIEPSQKVSEYIEGCLKINDYLHIGLDKDPKNTNNWYNFALTCYRLKIYDNAYEACKYILNLNPEHTKARELREEIRSKYSFKYEHSIEQSLKKIYGEDY